MPFTDLSRSRGIQFRPLSKIAFYIFVANFLILMQLGAKHVESPFIEFGQISTVLYFSHFLIIVPLVSLLENSLIELHTSQPLNKYEEKPTVKIPTSIKLLVFLIFYLLVYLALLYFGFTSMTVSHAMEPDSSLYDTLLSKISEVKDKVTYFKEQTVFADQEFKTILSEMTKLDPEDLDSKHKLTKELENTRQSMKDCQTNLESEKRMLKILEAKKESGDFTAIASSPTVTKRPFSN